MLSKAASSTIFWVFGMTWPGMEPWSPGPLANTLLIRPVAQCYKITYNAAKMSIDIPKCLEQLIKIFYYLILLLKNGVKCPRYKIFLFNTNNLCQFNGFKCSNLMQKILLFSDYFYLIIVICLHMVIWF